VVYSDEKRKASTLNMLPLFDTPCSEDVLDTYVFACFMTEAMSRTVAVTASMVDRLFYGCLVSLRRLTSE